MNCRKRAKICQLQVEANIRFENYPIGGVQVFNTESGEVEYLNSHPKTNWEAELAKANEEIQEMYVAMNIAANAKRGNRIPYQKPPENDKLRT